MFYRKSWLTSFLMYVLLVVSVSANPSKKAISNDQNSCSGASNLIEKGDGGKWSDCDTRIEGPQCLTSQEDAIFIARPDLKRV